MRHTSTSRTSASTKARRSPSRAGCTTAARAARSTSSIVRDGTRLHPGGDVEGGRRRGAVQGRPITCRRRRSLIVTGTVRADARAPGGYEIDVDRPRGRRRVARLPDHAEGARRRLPARSPAPVDPQPSGSRRSCACATRSSTPSATSSTSRGFILADTPIFTPAACEGTTTLFPVQYFEDTTAYLTQSGQLYNEANAMALGTRLLLRPDVPRREVEDAPAPHRVLDGRARDGLRRPRRRDGPGRGLVVVGRRRACSTRRQTRAEGARARHVEARGGEGAVPAHLHYDEAAKILHRQGPAVRVGRRLRRHRRDGAVRAVRPAGAACTATRPRSRRST